MPHLHYLRPISYKIPNLLWSPRVSLRTRGRMGERVMVTSVALGEHEVHWRTFLQSLVERGLCGVELVISDAHEGLKAARKAVFGGVP